MADGSAGGIRVRFLGTGGPFPASVERGGSCLVVEVGDELLMFDSGRGTVSRAAEAGVELADLGRVFITHHHFDHMGDLGDVILTSWLTGRTRPLDIDGPAGTERIVNELVTGTYGLDIEFRTRLEAKFAYFPPVVPRDVESGLVYSGNGFDVYAEFVDHGHGIAPPDFAERWKCLGYRVETPTRTLAISGDAVPCAGLTRLAKGADLLVQCCYLARSEIVGEHFERVARYTLTCADQAGKIAQETGARRLVLTHLRPKSEELVAEMLRDVRGDFDGPVSVANDLDVLEV